MQKRPNFGPFSHRFLPSALSPLDGAKSRIASREPGFNLND